MSSLLRNLIAILAIAVRTSRIYSRYRFNVVTQVFNQLVWLGPLYFLGRAFEVDGNLPGFAAYTGTQDYASFLIIGWILSGYVGTAFWWMGWGLFEEMLGGTLEANWLTPSPRWVLVAGSSILGLLRQTLLSAVLVGVAWITLGLRFEPNAVRAALVLLPAFVILYGIGFAVAGMVLLAKEPSNLVDMLSYGISVFAGDRFPPSVLPLPLFALSLAIPLTYAMDGLRHALTGSAPLVAFHVEIIILAASMFALIGGGLAVFAWADRRVRRLGTLAHH